MGVEVVRNYERVKLHSVPDHQERETSNGNHMKATMGNALPRRRAVAHLSDLAAAQLELCCSQHRSAPWKHSLAAVPNYSMDRERIQKRHSG